MEGKSNENLNQQLILHKLEGYAGIRLKGGHPLVFKPGINLLVGRNGCGKTNLIRLIHLLAGADDDVRGRIESKFFITHAIASLNNAGSTHQERFGDIKVTEYSVHGHAGMLEMGLSDKVTQEYVLQNLMRNGIDFQSYIELKGESVELVRRYIHGSDNRPKIEMSGYVLNSGIFARDSDNKAYQLMEGPIKSVADFVRKKMIEFFEGPAFISKITELEKIVNEKFSRFLGTANKQIKINCHDISATGRISLSLMDNGNFIQSADISTGESILLNLVFALATAKQEGCDMLTLDEPDSHMHDDMIQVLVDELSEFSRTLPNCIIVLASHSTSLIEKLAALGEESVNIITFDGDRNVENSKSDVELINALHRNGVSFSPLMLSRRSNIFIENQFRAGTTERDFYLKFFSTENLPNIIPIGTSGNVDDSDSFGGILEELLGISNVSFVGVKDGDIWLKKLLVQYMKDEIRLDSLIETLQEQRGTYIRDSSKKNLFYFNFWEIENLYLMSELLGCWRLNGKGLNESTYQELLIQNKEVIIQEYLQTFLKSLARIPIHKKYSIEDFRLFAEQKFSSFGTLLQDHKAVSQKMISLIDAILNSNLIQWVPGKEIKKLLEHLGYLFDDGEFVFPMSNLGEEIREILNYPHAINIGKRKPTK